jgi:hypothetical protein
MMFEIVSRYDRWVDYELVEKGRNAACRSIMLTTDGGEPSYAILRRSLTPDGIFGEKCEFVLGPKAFAALVKAWEGEA